MSAAGRKARLLLTLVAGAWIVFYAGAVLAVQALGKAVNWFLNL